MVVEPAILSVNRADRNYQRDHCFSFYRTAIRGSDEDRIAFLNTSGFRVFRVDVDVQTVFNFHQVGLVRTRLAVRDVRFA